MNSKQDGTESVTGETGDLDKVAGVSENATTTPAAYDAPPNGGFAAWLQVVGSFFLFFNSW